MKKSNDIVKIELLYRLDGLLIESGKFYSIRESVHFHEDVKINQFIQAMFNYLFNFLFIPNKHNTLFLSDLKNNGLVLFREFIEKKYINNVEILNKIEAFKIDDMITNRYNATIFQSKYINDYLKCINKNKNVKKILLFIISDKFKDKMYEFINNEFNKTFERYSINDEEINYLFKESSLCIEKIIEEQNNIKILELWESAMTIKCE